MRKLGGRIPGWLNLIRFDNTVKGDRFGRKTLHEQDQIISEGIASGRCHQANRFVHALMNCVRQILRRRMGGRCRKVSRIGKPVSRHFLDCRVDDREFIFPGVNNTCLLTNMDLVLDNDVGLTRARSGSMEIGPKECTSFKKRQPWVGGKIENAQMTGVKARSARARPWWGVRELSRYATVPISVWKGDRWELGRLSGYHEKAPSSMARIAVSSFSRSFFRLLFRRSLGDFPPKAGLGSCSHSCSPMPPPHGAMALSSMASLRCSASGGIQ